MNTFYMMKAMEKWALDNFEENHTGISSLYFFIINRANTLGWADSFNLPTDNMCHLMGIKNWRTYNKALEALEKAGFIKIIQKSKNQWTANLISLIEFDNEGNAIVSASVKNTVAHTKANTEAHTKAVQEHDHKHGSHNKTIKHKKDKTKNNKTINSPEGEESVFSFIDFWNAYDKKTGSKSKCEKKYNQLSEEIRALIKKHVPEFVKSTPKKQFRPYPEKYINNQGWGWEIIPLETDSKASEGAKRETPYIPPKRKGEITENAFLATIKKADKQTVFFAMSEDEFNYHYDKFSELEDFEMVSSLFCEEIEKKAEDIFDYYCKQKAIDHDTGKLISGIYESYKKSGLRFQIQSQRLIKIKKYIEYKKL